MQLNHYNTNFKKQTFPITIVCDTINNAPNIGSLFRIADAFGVEELVFCGDAIPLGKRMKRTSRSTEKFVNYRLASDIKTIISDLKNKDYELIALELTEKSIPITNFSIERNSPIALVIGNENFGVSENVLKTVDQSFHIPMYGENSSMNVVQATSIALYEITNQLVQ